MKLRTSFFNLRVVKKNLTRFAPLWILFSIAEILGLLLFYNSQEPGQLAQDLKYLMGPLSVAYMGYALLVAACLFGDLFDSRMCYGLHAMPMRREGWLLTHLASGAVFALIPAIAGGALAAVLLQEHAWVALMWQGIGLLQFLFFFGLAVFCAMCAGKRLGMIGMYALLNFLSVLIFWLASLFYQPLLRGVVLSQDQFLPFCPVVSFCMDDYVDLHYDKILGLFFRGYLVQDWRYLWICGGVGVALLVLAWLLYRKRNLEHAGDFISFRPLRGLFLLAYTLTAGALLYSVTGILGTYKDYGFLAVGLLIGYFTGWMLLERTVKVFKGKVILGFVLFAAVFAGSMGLTKLDPLGRTTYIPPVKDLQSVNVYFENQRYSYTSQDEHIGWYITDPVEIARAQALHQQMMRHEKDPDDAYMTVYVQYNKSNGNRIYRSYQITPETAAAEELRVFFSDLRAVMNTNRWDQVKDTIYGIVVYGFQENQEMVEIKDPDQQQALLKALEADSAAGALAQNDYLHRQDHQMGREGAIDLAWRINSDGLARSEYITIYEDCVHTLAFLETLE